MTTQQRTLLIEQLDRKLERLRVLKTVEVPPKGWINAIRTAMNMSLAQLGRRLHKTAASVGEIEQREQHKTVTLKKLIEAAEALDLEFVYAFLPKKSSLQKTIEQQALKVAREIVMRTSHSMALEDQENSQERLQKAIQERAQTLMRELPRHLWD